MDLFGSYALLLAFALAAYAIVGGIAAIITHRPLLIKSARNYDLSAYLRDWLAGAPKQKGDLKLEVDVDPMSFL